MTDESSRRENPNRSAWIIAGAIIVAALLIVWVIQANRAEEKACIQWQEDVRAKTRAIFSSDERQWTSVVAPTIPDRPENCPFP